MPSTTSLHAHTSVPPHPSTSQHFHLQPHTLIHISSVSSALPPAVADEHQLIVPTISMSPPQDAHPDSNWATQTQHHNTTEKPAAALSTSPAIIFPTLPDCLHRCIAYTYCPYLDDCIDLLEDYNKLYPPKKDGLGGEEEGEEEPDVSVVDGEPWSVFDPRLGVPYPVKLGPVWGTVSGNSSLNSTRLFRRSPINANASTNANALTQQMIPQPQKERVLDGEQIGGIVLVTILLIIMTVVVCFVVGIHFGMRSARRARAKQDYV